MKSLLFFLLIGVVGRVGADELITAETLRPQVVLHIQTFITSADGKQIKFISSSQGRYSLQTKNDDISSVWSDNPQGFSPVYLDFRFRVTEDKSLALTVTQYASVRFDVKTGKVAKQGKGRSQTFTLTDFGSVSWISESTAAGRVVTRFTPLISVVNEAMKLTFTPLSIVDAIITDNAGRVWAEGSSAESEVIRYQTVYGTILVSFTEFKGSKEIGKAKGNLLELNLSDKLTVRIRSEKPVLGEGISAKVYGLYLPSDKTSSRIANSISALSAESAEKEIRGNSKD